MTQRCGSVTRPSVSQWREVVLLPEACDVREGYAEFFLTARPLCSISKKMPVVISSYGQSGLAAMHFSKMVRHYPARLLSQTGGSVHNEPSYACTGSKTWCSYSCVSVGDPVTMQVVRAHFIFSDPPQWHRLWNAFLQQVESTIAGCFRTLAVANTPMGLQVVKDLVFHKTLDEVRLDLSTDYDWVWLFLRTKSVQHPSTMDGRSVLSRLRLKLDSDFTTLYAGSLLSIQFGHFQRTCSTLSTRIHRQGRAVQLHTKAA